ncbi:MAG: hypothetical protein KA767_14430 [Saprospiraceae bacterium]|nr:hypothetical protein [Saprospiraceae bacterium]
MENNNKDNSRRSALKKIAGASAVVLGIPLAKVLWASPNSGVVDKGEEKETLTQLFAVGTTCAMITTFGTTRQLFATFPLTTTPV